MIDKPKRIELAPHVSATIKWEYDDTPDLSWLGEFTNTMSDWVIDRKMGWLLGDFPSPSTFEFPLTSDLLQEEPYGTVPNSAAIDKDAQKRLVELGFDPEQEYEVFEYDETYELSIVGPRIVRSGLNRHYGWNEMRYFNPGNHLPHKPESWNHVTEESKAQVIAKHGSLENADIAYALEDWKRMEDYCHDFWYMQGCIATVYVNGIEMGESSVWGIESDSDKEYIAEVERDELSAALRHAKKQMAETVKFLDELQSIDLKNLKVEEK